MQKLRLENEVKIEMITGKQFGFRLQLLRGSTGRSPGQSKATRTPMPMGNLHVVC